MNKLRKAEEIYLEVVLEKFLNEHIYNTELLVDEYDGKEEAILNYIVELIQDRIDSYA